MNESSMLYKTSRALLIKNKNRYAFGEAVVVLDNPYYDGNRLVIGKYHQASVVDEAVELTDKEKLDKFEESSYEFLNALNHGLRNYDSHFNISGRQHGDIYIQENAHDDTWSFFSSEDDYGLMQECAWNQYLYNKARIQSELKSYVKEASIITNESLDIADKIDKLTALNEDDNGMLSNAWEKFKNFLNKMWLKFNEFIARNLNSTRGYLEKYKDIILNRAVTIDNIEVDADYRQGVQRLGQQIIAEPNTGQLDKVKNTEEGEDLDKEIQKLLFPEYANHANVDFGDFVKSYFKGSDDPNTNKFNFSSSDISMSDLYNYCYNYDKIRNTLEKNKTRLQNAGVAFSKRLKELEAEQTTTTQANVANYNSNENKKEGNQEPKGGKKTTTNVKTEMIKRKDSMNPKFSYNIASDITDKSEAETVLRKVQDEIQKEGNAANKINKYNAEASKYTGIRYQQESYISNKLGVVLELKIGSENKSSSSGTGAGASVTSQNNLGRMTNPNGNLEKVNTNFTGDLKNQYNTISKDDIKIFTTKCNSYIKAGGKLFGGMCTAAETIFNDYLAIIKAHVKSYLGKDGDEVAAKAVTNVSPETRNFNSIEGAQQLLNRIEQSKNITDEKARKQEEANILDSGAASTGRTFNSIDQLAATLKQRIQELQKEAEAKAQQQQQGQGQPAQGNG